MSYGQNQNRNTESWNNDPNNFSNPSGPDNSGAFEQQRGGFQDQTAGYNDQQWSQDQGTRPTDTSTGGTDPAGRRQQQGEYGRDDFDTSGNNQGARGHFAGISSETGSTGTAGNTSDVNTFGAGGNAFGTRGSGAGGNQFGAEPQSRAREGDNWDRTEDSQDTAATGEKPSMGQKVKGLAERITGHH
ncbi:hypothetical protein K466DRAFT_312416 [Polyporus arcularius HHB13444]|uniref:Uncharacterized protein n=1 Tax=Polyporus arcularius HHB13444 TaxID=1314778 RepID=A0A5C3NXS0_9APHY|nr:hypothetical protein K466DRAFT_312416 [Polyporus arcularius HHB13444]